MVDINRKFTRLTGIRDNKYVEFDFAIDDPEIFVELVLPFEMYESFCEKNRVTILPPNDDVKDKYERLLWRAGKAGRAAR